MENIKIESVLNPNESDFKQIEEGISVYNYSKIGIQKSTPVGCFARDRGKLIGGIKGTLFRNYLNIETIWVDEDHRERGIGKKLISGIEKLSMENGVFRSRLSTGSFQVPDFYLRCGYRIIARIDDIPEGETEYYLYKRLDENDSLNDIQVEITENDGENIFKELKRGFEDTPEKSDINPIGQ
jgi:ribosomal protein S18 acetylase RimI-like enzyme